jgi:hypothetical protein
MAKQRQMSDQFNAIIARVDNTEDEAWHDVVDTPDKPPWQRKVFLFFRKKDTHSPVYFLLLPWEGR